MIPFVAYLAPGPAIDVAAYPKPRVVLTDASSQAIVWWDATTWVDRMLVDGTPHDRVLGTLELEAVRLFMTRLPKLPQGTRHLRVVVAFAKSGLVSGPYRTGASEGVRTLLVVEGSAGPNVRIPAGWEADARRGVLPPGLTVKPSPDLDRLSADAGDAH